MVFLLSGILNEIQRSEMLLGPSIILSMLRCLQSFDLHGLILYLLVDYHCCTQAIITIVLASVSFDHSIFLDLSSIFLLIITVVLKPSSLLYFPSMTSICYLLNIFQQSPPLALMATKAPKFFSPPLTSMSKKRHAPPDLLQ
jgi:hypothetical protein